jgi:hypothetical protein
MDIRIEAKDIILRKIELKDKEKPFYYYRYNKRCN